MSRKYLYFLALFFGLAGQIWIFYSYIRLEREESTFTTCLFRRVTGIPCPSCGTIHSIISITHGNFRKAFSENPLGFPGILIAAVIPFWIIADLAFRRNSFFGFYTRTERLLSRTWILFSLLFLIMLVWVYKLVQFYHLLQ